MRAIGYEDGKNLAAFFNISFPLWMRQSHIVNTPRCQNWKMWSQKINLFCQTVRHAHVHGQAISQRKRGQQRYFPLGRPDHSEKSFQAHFKSASIFDDKSRSFLSAGIFCRVILAGRGRWGPWTTATMWRASGTWRSTSGTSSTMDTTNRMCIFHTILHLTWLKLDFICIMFDKSSLST